MLSHEPHGALSTLLTCVTRLVIGRPPSCYMTTALSWVETLMHIASVTIQGDHIGQHTFCT